MPLNWPIPSLQGVLDREGWPTYVRRSTILDQLDFPDHMGHKFRGQLVTMAMQDPEAVFDVAGQRVRYVAWTSKRNTKTRDRVFVKVVLGPAGPTHGDQR
jgi:hypothetical protein